MTIRRQGDTIRPPRSTYRFDLSWLHSPDWARDSLCAQTDPEAFYPEKGGSSDAAKKTCLSCSVREQCLQYALDNGERFGIWGGLAPRERRKLEKQQLGGAA